MSAEKENQRLRELLEQAVTNADWLRNNQRLLWSADYERLGQFIKEARAALEAKE